jgi:hypothetical protein
MLLLLLASTNPSGALAAEKTAQTPCNYTYNRHTLLLLLLAVPAAAHAQSPFPFAILALACAHTLLDPCYCSSC